MKKKQNYLTSIEDKTKTITKSIYTNRQLSSASSNIRPMSSNTLNSINRPNTKADFRKQLLSPWENLLTNIESGEVISKPKKK